MTIQTYDDWWEVPAGLCTKAQLAELEFPRKPGVPVAQVWSADFRGRKDRLRVDLFNPDRCEPTAASAAVLQAAAARTTTRALVCADCGCRPERTLDQDGRDPLCQLCQHIRNLRAAQTEALEKQLWAAERAAKILATPDAVILHVTQNVPPPTPAGSKRPPVSARIRACDIAEAGRKLLDVTVSMASARAKFRDPDAVPFTDVRDKILAALADKTLVCWSDDVRMLSAATSGVQWPGHHSRYDPREIRVRELSALWRAELTSRGKPVAVRHPGTPDRLWLHLCRMAASAHTLTAG